MNVLDENIGLPQVKLLRERRIAFRKIGSDVGRKGMSDRDIIALLHGLNRPTLFSLDEDFYQHRWCHAGYCLIRLDIPEDEVAKYVQRVLKHPQLNTRARRMGLVLNASPDGLVGWRLNQRALVRMAW